MKFLKHSFDTRPIWSIDALSAQLAFNHFPLTKQEILEYLPSVGYRFSKGPWRNLWIRYTFDPRTNPEAAKLVS